MFEYIQIIQLLAVVGFFILMSSLILLSTHYHWTLKAIVICAGLAVLFLNYSIVQGLTGWPTYEKLPEKFKIVWTRIVEPTRSQHGRLFIWVESTEKGKQPNPRIYEIPYTKELHKKTVEAQQRIKRGEPVYGLRESNSKDSDKDGNGNKSGKSGGLLSEKLGLGSGRYNEDASVEGYRLIAPPGELPSK